MQPSRTRTHVSLLLTLGLGALSACTTALSDGSGDGTVTVALTDAASDDLASFCVDVESIRLMRTGDEVGVLDQTVRVDLVTLTDVSQILNVASVPVASYRSAEVTLNFTNAEAWLIGEPTPATLLDGDGNALTGSVTLPITVATAVAATANRNRVLELDFDLNQSVRADLGTNSVFVEPAIVLRVDRTDPKELVVVGELQSVDASSSTLSVEMQTLAGQPITTVSVGTGSGTLYQIDGVPALGSAGFNAVQSLPSGTWIQLYGSVDTTQARIDAAYVEVGSGTYNGGDDIVQGHVVQRIGTAGSDPTLTVVGHSNNADHTAFQFNTLFTVNASFANTTVVRRGGATSFDTDHLCVGQQVRLFGTLSGTTLDMTTAPSVARLQLTRALGFANAAPSAGNLELDLARIDLRPQAAFTWSDGGPTPPDPAMFDVEVGSLADGLAIMNTTAVEARGFFPPVDDANADFVAVSVTNRDDAPSLLLLADRTGGLSVAPTVTGGAIEFSISGSAALGELALVDRGFAGTTPIPTSPDLSVERNPIFGIYALRARGTGEVALFLNYDLFLTAFQVGLGQGADVYNLGALGMYDLSTNTMTAGVLLVSMD